MISIFNCKEKYFLLNVIIKIAQKWIFVKFDFLKMIPLGIIFERNQCIIALYKFFSELIWGGDWISELKIVILCIFLSGNSISMDNFVREIDCLFRVREMRNQFIKNIPRRVILEKLISRYQKITKIHFLSNSLNFWIEIWIYYSKQKFGNPTPAMGKIAKSPQIQRRDVSRVFPNGESIPASFE